MACNDILFLMFYPKAESQEDFVTLETYLTQILSASILQIEEFGEKAQIPKKFQIYSSHLAVTFCNFTTYSRDIRNCL